MPSSGDRVIGDIYNALELKEFPHFLNLVRNHISEKEHTVSPSKFHIKFVQSWYVNDGFIPHHSDFNHLRKGRL